MRLSSADISSRNSKYWHKQRNGIKNIALQKALASKEEESKMYEKKMKLAHVPVPEKISVTHLEPIDSIDMTQRLAFWNDMQKVERAQHATEMAQHASIVDAEEAHGAAMALQNHREKIESMPNGPAKEAEMELLAHEKVHVAAKVERAQRATEMMVATKEVHDAAMALKIHRQETESMPNGHAKDVTMEMMVEKEEVMSAKKERAQHVAESMHFAKEAADATQALRRVQGTIRGLQARHMVAVLHDCRGEGHRMLGRSGRWLTI